MAANDDLAAGQLSHAVDLSRYSDSVVARLIAILNRADVAIFADLTARLGELDPSTFTMDRLEGMLYSVRAMNAEAYGAVGRELTAELRDLTQYEAAFQRGLLASVLPAQVSVAAVAVDAVHAAAMARPFQGSLLKGFLADMDAKKAALIRRSIADGFVQGKTTDVIVRELRGTKAKGYADGLLEVTRRDAQAVVRTALAHTAAFAQQKTYDANDDLIKGYVWMATMDLRTSSPCRLRDHREYDTHFKPVGHSIPWGAGPGLMHWNCRSVRSPLTKSWKELTGVDIESFTSSERASMDGTVPNSMDYGQWLQKQKAQRQDDVLGVTRGKLMRDGSLSLADMYSAKGDPLSLADLRKRDAKAFEKAGL